MSWMSSAAARVRAIFGKRRLETELRDELDGHLEMAVETNLKLGMTPEQARRQALLRLGNAAEIQERYREQAGVPAVEHFLQDIRYGLRWLWRSPGFTAVALLTLALGIGANTAIFSVINAVLLRPLPWEDPDRLVVIFEGNPGKGFPRFAASPPNYFDYRDQAHSFHGMAAYYRGWLSLTGRGDAQKLRAVSVTPNLFSVLGEKPFLGRGFLPEEGVRGRDHVAVLSYALWQQQFGGAASAIGQTIKLDGEDYTVVGVAAPGFSFPLRGAELWVPLTFGPNVATQRGAHYLSVVGRVKPGATLEQANRELKTIGGRLEAAYPDKNKGWSAFAEPMNDTVMGPTRRPLEVLFGAVGLLVLIACANVANLLLARASGRQRELAVRAALGASAGRIVRQLLTESLVLAALGGVAGVLLAKLALATLLKLGPADIPRLGQARIDGSVLAFTAALTVLTALLFGVIPALRIARPDTGGVLKTSGRSSGGRESSRFRDALVVGELALSLMLLAGAGLLIRSFMQLRAVDPGFSPASVLTFNVTLPEKPYPDTTYVTQFFTSALERLRAIPGVQSAGAVWPRPLSGNDFSSSFSVKGAPPPAPGNEPSAELRVASRDYFRTVQIPLLRGRLFNEADTQASARVLLASESAARRLFPHDDVVGKELTFGASAGYEKIRGTVVGVVGDVHDFGLDEAPPPAFYSLLDQSGVGDAGFVLRTQEPPQNFATAARAALRAVDRDLPLSDLGSMEEFLGQTLARRRFYMLLLTVFAGVAFALAIVGMYGVIAYSTSQRTHELGIRMALGAERAQVLRLVLSGGLTLTLAGVVAGVVGAALLTRVLKSLLVGISATDARTFLVVSLALAAGSLVATYIPARRATRVEPVSALRYE